MMTPISVKKGLYFLNKVTFETQNGKLVPIGQGFYKTESSPTYSKQEIRIRLGALYNHSSYGPKEISPELLPNYLLHVQSLKIVDNTTNVNAPLYSVTWDVIEDEAHQNLLNEHRAIEDGFLTDDYNMDQEEINFLNCMLSVENDSQSEDDHY